MVPLGKCPFPPARCRLRHMLLALVGTSLLVLGCLLTGVDVLLGITVVPVVVPEDSTRLVDTPGCVIPGFSVYDPTVVQFLNPRAKLLCSSLPPLTVSPGASVSLNWSALPRYDVSNDAVRCCAQTVTRLWQDKHNYDLDVDNLYELSSCTPFTGEGQYRPASPVEAAVVQCKDVTALLPHPFYTNVHYFLPRDKVAEKIRAFKVSGGWAANPDRLNVIIFGTDSVSRLNLERHLPKTHRWLKNHRDHLDFVGYNKIGDNTDPNLIALTLGLHPDYTDTVPCHSRYGTVLDDCPFLWKQFSKQGYVTVYGEDSPDWGIYHYAKPAYFAPPTDFYSRPGFLASERKISFSEGPYSYHFKNCQGPTPSVKVIHDYALKSLRTFYDVPTFGLFWSASTSHERLNDVSSVDDYQVEFLSNLKRFGHLNNTVVFFMSDHGLRFGKIRSTYIGSLEERLPYMFMLVPPWFKARYPDLMRNLEVNQERLVTSFDFHHTMKDFLHQNFTGSLIESSNILDDRLTRKSLQKGNEDLLSYDLKAARNFSNILENLESGDLGYHQEGGWTFAEEELDIEMNTNGSLGQSLFEVVSPYRTCRDVHIPDHFCTCLATAEIDTGSQLAVDAARYVIEELNSVVQNFSVCHPWTLREVVLARSGGYSTSARSLALRPVEGDGESSGEKALSVLITISAAPGDARFEATLERLTLGTFRLTGDISRITRYDGYDEEEERPAASKDFEDLDADDNGSSGDVRKRFVSKNDDVNNNVRNSGQNYSNDTSKNSFVSNETSVSFKKRRLRRAPDASGREKDSPINTVRKSRYKRELSASTDNNEAEQGQPATREENDLGLEDPQRDRINLRSLKNMQTVAEKNKQDCADQYKGDKDFAKIRKYCYC